MSKDDNTSATTDLAGRVDELVMRGLGRAKFGLEQQGHIHVVEEMLDKGCSWQEINRAIGWAGDAARDFYLRYLRRKNKKIAEAAAVAKATKGWDDVPHELHKRFDDLFKAIGA